jgi:3'(2'), 5'-bisphosphate nucleotidase
LYPPTLFGKSKANLDINQEIDINDSVTVWVDPLDGTLSYVNGEFDAVTTLIGLSINKNPVLGVIGQPYSAELVYPNNMVGRSRKTYI